MKLPFKDIKKATTFEIFNLLKNSPNGNVININNAGIFIGKGENILYAEEEDAAMESLKLGLILSINDKRDVPKKYLQKSNISCDKCHKNDRTRVAYIMEYDVLQKFDPPLMDSEDDNDLVPKNL